MSSAISSSPSVTCEATRTALSPSRDKSAQPIQQRPPINDVEARGRLVQDQQLGPVRKGKCQGQQLLLPAREVPDLLERVDPELIEQPVEARPVPACEVRPREAGVPLDGPVLVEHGLLRHIAEPVLDLLLAIRVGEPEHSDGTSALRNLAAQDSDERRLACAVWPKQPGDRAAADLQRHVLQAELLRTACGGCGLPESRPSHCSSTCRVSCQMSSREIPNLAPVRTIRVDLRAQLIKLPGPERVPAHLRHERTESRAGQDAAIGFEIEVGPLNGDSTDLKRL